MHCSTPWCSQADSSDLSLAEGDPQGFLTLQGELESLVVLLCGDLRYDMLCLGYDMCCPELCGCITSPRAFYLQPYWSPSDLNLLGVIL